MIDAGTDFIITEIAFAATSELISESPLPHDEH